MAEPVSVSADIHTTQSRRPRIGPPWLIAILLLGYFGGAVLLGQQSPCDNDFGGIFMPSARYAAAGQPLDMYQVRIGAYPNANGPLGEIVMGWAVLSARALHLQRMTPRCFHIDSYPLQDDSIPLRMWVVGFFALVPLGIGAELLRLADTYRARPFTGWRRFLIWLLILAEPLVWDSSIFYGHFEQLLEIYLALLAARAFTAERAALSGALLGLALLNRTAGIFVVIPLGLVLIAERKWLQAARFGGALAGTVALGLLPFYLHDRQDLVYSLSSFRAQLPIMDGSFWTFVRGTPWEAPLQSWDSTISIVLAIVVCGAMIGLGRVRQRNDPALYAVVCASLVCFAFGIKATWSYYFTEPLIWGLAWVLMARKERQPWWEFLYLPLFFSLLMIVTEVRISLSNGYFDMPYEISHQIRWQVEFLSAICATGLLLFDGIILVQIAQRAGPIVPRIAQGLSGLGARFASWYNIIRPQNDVGSHRT